MKNPNKLVSNYPKHHLVLVALSMIVCLSSLAQTSPKSTAPKKQVTKKATPQSTKQTKPTSNKPAASNGYEITVTLKPYKNQYIYLGHYYGKQLPIIDSVKLNDKSVGVFKGTKPLGGGIYLIGYPGKSGYFEVLVGKEQKFSVQADTALRNQRPQFVNSKDNILFNEYQAYMAVKSRELDNALNQRKIAINSADSLRWTEVVNNTNKEINQYRTDIMKKYPDAAITFLFTAMKEPEIPPANQHPGGKYDTAFVRNYYKSHYWDGVYFYDDRLLRTPFFEPKLDKYFEQIVYPNPDSVNKEIDWMMSYASINEDMQRFLLLKFVNRYLNQRYMWEDAVFVHIFEKYFAQKTYPWLNAQGQKTISDRAYSLMANILGSPAPDIILPDLAGKESRLYGVKAKYTLVVIWDPTCGHCKEVLPKVDTLYNTKWKNYDLKIYALAKETDGTQKDWTNFITEKSLDEGWLHVYYTKQADAERINAGVPGYSQLFDVLSFPTLYLLDEDKRIIAKKLTYEQIDDLLLHTTKTK